MKLDVIIPVGPGHEDLFNEAAESVRMACLTNQGPFDEIKIKAINDTDGTLGRSAARNAAIDASDADWLFFLDADDLMHPLAFENVQPYIGRCDAVWGQITEFKDGLAVPRFQMPRIRDRKTLLEVDPYYTLQMGFFVRRDVMPRFDESMNAGEDWKAYLELWGSVKCLKQPDPFMINRRGHHSEGPKSATGRDWMNAVRELIENEREKLPA